ncbi:hypothetical protein Sango_2468100 [Sesamum angolense]|uniref:Bifunctional inhibitor/plant lipid transfer protein/seed storage helical domain-containing protein n=1 Tax=Sesamum angolense TaxID=2727404 RepID=A0AAE1W891_9LAMI|nr:hypothetical protein Sango_2468100 [Sesamum angolense]
MGLQCHFCCIIWVIAVHLVLFSTSSSLPANTQVVQGCSLVGINLQTCLVPSSQTAFALDSCCASLSLVVEAGYHCLCSLLGPDAYPVVFSSQLALFFSNCYISLPPLTHCHDPDPLVFAPPVAALPQPQPQPQPPPMPVQMRPDLPRDDQFVPLPPKVNEIPVNSSMADGDGNPSLSSSSPPPQLSIPETSDSAEMLLLLLSRNLLMIVPVFACIA